MVITQEIEEAIKSRENSPNHKRTISGINKNVNSSNIGDCRILRLTLLKFRY